MYLSNERCTFHYIAALTYSIIISIFRYIFISLRIV